MPVRARQTTCSRRYANRLLVQLDSRLCQKCFQVGRAPASHVHFAHLVGGMLARRSQACQERLALGQVALDGFRLCLVELVDGIGNAIADDHIADRHARDDDQVAARQHARQLGLDVGHAPLFAGRVHIDL